MQKFSPLLLLLLLVSCREETIVPPPPSLENVTGVSDQAEAITLTFGVNSTEITGYTTLAETFTTENANISIQVVSLDGRLTPNTTDPGRYQPIAEAADLFTYSTLDSLGVEQVALDLAPLLATSPDFDPPDFYPGLLPDDGSSIWGIPLAATYYLIYYDTSLFDAAGVDYPYAGWTWDDLTTTAQAMTSQVGDGDPRWGFVPTDLWTLTAPLLNGASATAAPTLASNERQTQLAWLSALFNDSAPWFDNYGQSDVAPVEQLTLIHEQGAAMWVDDHTFAWNGRRSGVSVAPYPIGILGDGTPMRVQQVAISRGTTHPEAAWQWLTFLSRQSPVALGLPVRRTVTAAANYWESLDAPLREAVQSSAERGVTFTLNSPALAALNTAVAQVVAGEPVESALQTAQETAVAQIENLTGLPQESITVATVSETTSEKRAIVFMASGAPYEFLSPYPDLAEVFMAEQPNIEIELRDLVLAYENQPPAEMLTGVDCFATYSGDPATDFALPLDPLLDGDLTLSPDDFYAYSMEQLTENGRLTGLPLSMSTQIIQYNKALFDAANEPYPPLEWTLDDFLVTAVALSTGEDEERQYGFGFSNPLGLAITALAQFDARLVDNNQDPVTLDFAEGEDALRWYATFVTEHQAMPPLPPLNDSRQLFQADTTFELIRSNRLAMWQSNTASAGFMAETLAEIDVGETTFPRGPNGRSLSSDLSVSTLYIHANATDPAACWEWFKFLTESPTVGEGNLPARKSTAASAAFAAQVGQGRLALYDVLLNQLDNEGTSQNNVWNANLWWLMAFWDVVLNGIPVEEALAQRQERFDLFLACVIDNDAFADSEKHQACYREADPDGMGILYGK